MSPRKFDKTPGHGDRPQEQAPGYVLVGDGRWTEAMLRRIAAHGDEPLAWAQRRPGWTGGLETRVLMLGSLHLGKIERRRPEHPWLVRLEGFQFWCPPDRAVWRWHHSGPRAVNGDLRAAKALVTRLVREARGIAHDLSVQETVGPEDGGRGPR